VTTAQVAANGCCVLRAHRYRPRRPPASGRRRSNPRGDARSCSADGDDDVAAGGDLEATAGADDEAGLALLDDGGAGEGRPGEERVAVADGGGAELAELGEVDEGACR